MFSPFAFRIHTKTSLSAFQSEMTLNYTLEAIDDCPHRSSNLGLSISLLRKSKAADPI
jgi:hypothetical protein